jgi:exodeoxyribonuclease III
MKIITYNVNGVRSAIKKGLIDWLRLVGAEVVCLQEVKADADQVDLTLFEQLGYQYNFWHSAEKKGYSGVAILSKIAPQQVTYGMGNAKYDFEGRLLQIDLADYSIICTYHPSGTTGDVRQQFKYEWLDDFYAYIQQVRQTHPNLVICGDYNICHKPIDIHNPVANKNSSGFLPQERAWFDKFVASGWVDAFRHFSAAPHRYTWWSNRGTARERNLGWRIDYHIVSEPLAPRLADCQILDKVFFSDHCPVLLELT